MRLKVDACESMLQVINYEVSAGRAANEGLRGRGESVMLRSRWSGSESRQEPHRKWIAAWAELFDFEISDKGQF